MNERPASPWRIEDVDVPGYLSALDVDAAQLAVVDGHVRAALDAGARCVTGGAPLDRPVAMFVDRSDEQLTRTAIEAGVSAYVVDGLQRDRIKPILDAAIARFHLFHKMRAELAATKAALEERKIIDRAKAILMKARGIDEEAAYALLRKTAMDQKRRVADIAQQLVMAAGLLT